MRKQRAEMTLRKYQAKEEKKVIKKKTSYFFPFCNLCVTCMTCESEEKGDRGAEIIEWQKKN